MDEQDRRRAVVHSGWRQSPMGKALKEWATILYAALAIALEERRLQATSGAGKART
jgi:hypothetical protein